MIDITAKQQSGGVGDRKGRKSQAKPQKKHHAINLPKNLSDSDNEGEDQFLSEDENDQYGQCDFYFKGAEPKMTKGAEPKMTKGAEPKMTKRAEPKMTKDQISRSCLEFLINEKKSNMIEALRKLKAVVKKYREDLCKIQLKDKGLKARSPFRNKLDEHKKNKLYEENVKREAQKSDWAVTRPPVNMGKVVVQNLLPMGRPEFTRSIQKEPELQSQELCDLVNAIQDVEFIASFNKLTAEEVEHVFEMFLSEPGSQMQMQQNDYSIPLQTQQIISPDMSHSYKISVHTPVTSPLDIDQYDSSYETGSPTSTVVTSPGSPATYCSPPRTSISYESDQELEPHMENSKIQSKTRALGLPPNCLTRCVIISPEFIPKSEPMMKPLGEVVRFTKISATDRLVEFQNSTSFCIQHFSIQLVRVIMSAKAQAASEKIEEFSKSLINTMKIKFGNKGHEGDIWQLSILAHVQFLLARASEYRSALLVRDEHNHSLLYIAAIEQYKKPLVARYIAESMFKVGFNPLGVDEKGNTILHLLAEQGDSHVHVLSELLMALGAKSVHAVNKAQQTALHTAVCSPKPHLTTVLTLLKMRANPLQQDEREMSALHYHIEQLVQRFPRLMEDVEVIRKMLQSLLSLDNESLIALNMLSCDPAVSDDLKAVILEEVGKYGVKELRLRK